MIEFKDDSTMLSTRDISCDSVRFKWKRHFKDPITAVAPALKHGNCESKKKKKMMVIHNNYFICFKIFFK